MENLEKAIAEIKEILPNLLLMENEPMSGHTSFKIGGPVRALAAPGSIDSLSKICYILKKHKLAPMMLGNGTNLLCPDEGLNDLFMMSTEKLQNMFLLPDGSIYAEAGVSLAKLATFAQQNGLAGLEFASGIPGTVGGGAIMNAGAYGGELKDCIQSIVFYYLPEQRLYEIDNEHCAFGYRASIFQRMGGCVILSAVFHLEPGDKDEISAKMRDFNERRREKQPLELPSAGSAFRRPEGHYAAQLIDEAGLRGFSVGGAQVSEKHAGFIVNTGSATSHDVYELMDHIRHTVYDKTGIALAPEIIILAPDFKLEDNLPDVPLHNVAVNDMGFSEEDKKK